MPIIRNLLLAVGAIMLIPSPPENGVEPTDSALAAPGFIVAASQTVADLGDFCRRQPGVCETAQYVAGKLELKAKYGVRILYEWANEAGTDPSPSRNEADAADALLTGSLKLAVSRGPKAGAPGTLESGDLLPDWREPLPATQS